MSNCKNRLDLIALLDAMFFLGAMRAFRSGADIGYEFQVAF